MSADPLAMRAPLAATSPALSSAGPRALLTPRRSNIALLLAACVLLPVFTERQMPLLFTPADNLILAEAAALAIAAISLNLLVGYAGQISLGHAALLGAGAFASGLITSRAGLPIWVGVPAAAVVTALVALVIGFPALRLRGSGTRCRTRCSAGTRSRAALPASSCRVESSAHSCLWTRRRCSPSPWSSWSWPGSSTPT